MPLPKPRGGSNVVKVVFECSENMNKYEEEFEFEDNVTDEQIIEEFSGWVWEQIGDRFSWHRKETERG